jgi:putative zinc finger/helix-turn-helix YgiT family protein
MNTLLPVLKNDPCPLCKSADVRILRYSDTVDFRNMELDVENLQQSKCTNCGHKWTTSEQRNHNNSVIREAYVDERDKLRTKDGLMTGQEIASIREYFGINQREAASMFGGGYNAFNKYESGEVLQSFAMDRLLRLTKVVGKPAVDFLRDVFSTPNFIVISTTMAGQSFTITVGSRVPYIPSTIQGAGYILESFEPASPSRSLLGLNPLLTPQAKQLTLARPR